VLIQLGINLILALSLYFPLSAGQLSLGQGGFMAIGAYVASWLTAVLGWPWPVAFAVGAAAAGAVGALVGLPALRVRGIYLVLMTMAFGEIVRVFFLNFAPTGAAQGFRGMPFVTSLPVVAGLAGALWAHYVQFIEPEEFGFARSVMPFTFVVVGGIETFWGALVGAAVLTVLPEWLRFLKEWRLALYALAMLAVMIVRPQGLIDHRLLAAMRRWRPGHAKEVAR